MEKLPIPIVKIQHNSHIQLCGIPIGIPERNIIHSIHRFRRFSQIIKTIFFIRENSCRFVDGIYLRYLRNLWIISFEMKS